MESSPASLVLSGAPGADLPWLDVSPPLQPAASDVEASLDAGLDDDTVSLLPDRDGHGSRRRDPEGPEGLMEQTMLARIDSDGYRREAMYAAATLGVSEWPSWLILAIERDLTGPAFEDRRL